MQTIEMPVEGMDCASCAAHVRSALEGVPGVASADVLVAAGKAVVSYDEVRPDARRMAEAVASAGYTVPPSGLPTDHADDAGRAGDAAFGRRALAVTGMVFGAVLLVVVVGEWLGLFEAATAAIPFPAGVAIVLLIGWPPLVSVLRAARSRRVTSHTLMTVGVLAALVIGQWVTAAVVAFFMRVGDFVEGFTVRKGRTALRELEALAPATARVERDGEAREVPVAEVRAGDVVVVRPGERIPVDGRVVDGHATVEQAAITGESMPVEAAVGDTVFAATIARGGALRISVTRVGAESTFGRVVRMVEAAEGERGRVQSFADRFSGWYLPVVGAIALATFLIRGDALATAAVLVVACSCAFAIATPVAMLASIGAAARRGLLIKGGAYIEALARADVVLVDKTGTFTTGRPVVSNIVALNGADPEEVLRLAASAESDAEHPLAAAIRAEAATRGVMLAAGADTRPRSADHQHGVGPAASAAAVATSGNDLLAMAGVGVTATVDGARVVVGNRRAVGLEESVPEAERLEQAGRTTAFVARDGVLVGVLGFTDEVRPEVPAALDRLRSMGLRDIEILTGDHEGAAAPVAQHLGVGYRAGLLPEDKIRIVREHQEQGRVVVMIGDGVNDAPALAQADVGIAMGAAGTDLALEVAHIALLRDDWSLVPDAFCTARRTMRVVKGNFAFTGVYNLVGLTLAAVGILPPILAAAAQSIPDLGILGNSARLLRGR